MKNSVQKRKRLARLRQSHDKADHAAIRERTYSSNDPPSDQSSKGDPMSYGRHKKEEAKKMVEYMDKLRAKEIEPIEAFSTMLLPQAPKPKKPVIPQESAHYRRTRPKSAGKKKAKKLSKNSNYGKLKKKFNAQLHKEKLPHPRVVGMRLLSAKEVAVRKSKKRKSR